MSTTRVRSRPGNCRQGSPANTSLEPLRLLSPGAGVTIKRGPSGRPFGIWHIPPSARTRPSPVASGGPYLLAPAHLLCALMVEGGVSPARTHLTYRKVAERAKKGTATTNPNGVEGIPGTERKYRLHASVLLRFRPRSTASIRGIFRLRTPPPRNAPALRCGSPRRNRGNIPFWPVGRTCARRPSRRTRIEPSPHKNRRGSRVSDTP